MVRKSDIDTKELGERMLERKRELMAEEDQESEDEKEEEGTGRHA